MSQVPEMPDHQPWHPHPSLLGALLHTTPSISREVVHGGNTHMAGPSLKEGDPNTAEPPLMPKREKLANLQGCIGPRSSRASPKAWAEKAICALVVNTDP